MNNSKINISSIWFVLFAVVSIIVVIPWSPFLFDYDDPSFLGVDSSGLIAYNELFLREVAWGREVMLPYGPFGFTLWDFYYPGTFVYLIMNRFFTAVALAVGLWGVAKKSGLNRLFLLLILAWVVIWVKLLRLDGIYTIIIILPNFMYFILDRERERPSIATLLVIGVSAMISLAKFPFFLLFTVQVIVITTSDFLIRRRPPIVLAVAIGTFLGWWLLAGQGLGALPAWIASSLSISSGFSEAGSLGFLEAWRVTQILIFLGTMAIFGTVHLTILFPQMATKSEKLLSLLGLGACLFLFFKHGIVRHDGHEAHTALEFFLIGGIYLFLVPFKKYRRTLGAILVIALVSFALMNLVVLRKCGFVTPIEIGRTTSFFTKQLRDLSDAPRVWKNLDGMHQEVSEKFRRNAGLPQLQGSVDIFPNRAGIAILTGMDYHPRVGFLSLDVSSSKLIELNAAHLRSAAGPDNVLFEICSIDGRLPTSSDAHSWRELISCYRVDEIIKNFVVLKRNAKQREYRLIPFSDTDVRWGDTISFDNPKARLIWAEVDVQLNLLGRVVNFFFKPPIVNMRTKLASNREIMFRIVPPMVRGGFILSPLVSETHQFMALQNSYYRQMNFLSDQVVQNFSLHLEPMLPALYKERINVRLSWLEFEPLPPGTSPEKGFDRLIRLGVLLEGAEAAPSSAQLHFENLSQRQVLFAHAPNSIHLPISPDKSHATIKFGMFEGAYDASSRPAGAPIGDGVEFLVLGKSGSTNEHRIIYRRFLNPIKTAEDRGEQQAIIDFGQEVFTELLFQTSVGTKGDGSFDWSYWSDVILY